MLIFSFLAILCGKAPLQYSMSVRPPDLFIFLAKEEAKVMCFAIGGLNSEQVPPIAAVVRVL